MTRRDHGVDQDTRGAERGHEVTLESIGVEQARAAIRARPVMKVIEAIEMLLREHEEI